MVPARHPHASTLPWRVRLAYGAPALALAMVGVPVFVFLPRFYTDVVGLNMTLFGAIFLGARLFDAVTDPLIGWLSDASRSPRGRRRPFIAWSALPLALSALWIYAPPAGPIGSSHSWFAVGIFALFLFWTAVIVPYKSLGPELTADYHERTVLFAIRESALVVGTLLAAAVPLGIAALFDLSGDADGERFKFAVYGGVAAVVTVLACAWSVVDVPERPTASMPAAPGSRRVVAGVRDVLRNRPFAILLVAYTVIALGSNLPATLITYYVRYVLGREDVSIYLVLYFVIGIITMPLWVSLSGRIGKKNAWLAAMAINTLAFTPVFFLGHGQALWYAVCVGLSGTAGVAAIALPSSMQADVIEYDELRSGERREGQFVGLWSISEKFAAALGVGLSMPILEFAGYVPNVEQSPQVIDTLKVLYVVVPVACNALAFAIALRYPIDRSVHSAIQAAMVNKSRGLPFVDPLAAPYRDAKPSREAV